MSIQQFEKNSKLKIRAMTCNDLDLVLEIEQELFTAPWSRQMFENEMQNNFSFIVELDKLIGFFCGYKVLSEFSITNVGICKSFQKKGLGTELVNLLVEKLIKLGCLDFFLEVRKSNRAAIKLYNKCGFKQIGIRSNYYYSPEEDALIMAKYTTK